MVFFGVYAVFCLNRFDAERRDANRRRQLFDALEHKVSGTVEALRSDLADARTAIEGFDHRLAASEMPLLAISYSHTAYNATDDATLLQAGGLELLDVETLDRLREVNRLQRRAAGPRVVTGPGPCTCAPLSFADGLRLRGQRNPCFGTKPRLRARRTAHPLRRKPWLLNRRLYHRRNEVERLFRRLKSYRRACSPASTSST